MVLGLAIVARPAWHLFSVAWSDVDERVALPDGVIDDASRLNRTDVVEVWPVPDDDAEAQIAALLARARRDRLPVSIAGARHSMGGHTIAPDGIVLDMRPFDAMQLDAERSILTVQSGAQWSEVIPYLDARGFSVGVLQSNSSFSVGGSISVNCHGWVYDRPPICATVESFRLMCADGNVHRCTRDENAELFSLALGGYGLFGVILDVELRVVPNECYRIEQHVVSDAEAMDTFDREVEGHDDVAMFYARLDINPGALFSETILNVMRPVPDAAPPPLAPLGFAQFRRAVFRGSVGSTYGKHLRWRAETRLQPWIRKDTYSRNQLLSEAVDVFENRTADTTDVLHEYFVPHAAAPRFLGQVRRIVARHRADLLNVTVRSVNEDTDTFLRYADQRMLGFVMLFNQAVSEAGERRMASMTRDLIDAALAVDGRHYLTYRLHASDEQLRRAYPQAEEFFAKKRAYDPDGLFQNGFYLRYGSPPARGEGK